jgi:hypothetical protein
MFILTLVEDIPSRNFCMVRMELQNGPWLPLNCGLLYMTKEDWLVFAGVMTLGGRQAEVPVDVTITEYLNNLRKTNGSQGLQEDHIESLRDS